MNSWDRCRGANGGAVKSRTLDVGLEKIRVLEIGLPKTGASHKSVSRDADCT